MTMTLYVVGSGPDLVLEAGLKGSKGLRAILIRPKWRFNIDRPSSFG